LSAVYANIPRTRCILVESYDACRRDAIPEPSGAEESELDLTPGLLDKTNDPVRMYLREMGTVPLLTREGEVAIAKRIERGQLLVLKTITRSPIILRELLTIGEDLRKGKCEQDFHPERPWRSAIRTKTVQIALCSAPFVQHLSLSQPAVDG
jgi:hypothetical protein